MKVNRRFLGAIGLVSMTIVSACISCVQTQNPAPTPALTPAPESESDVMVIECPNEAHIGEYITVRVRILEQPGTKYFLSLYGPGHEFLNGELLGDAYADDNSVVCWYVALPTKWTVANNCKKIDEENRIYDCDVYPGSYILRIWGRPPDSGFHYYLDHAIILKR